MNDIYLQSVKLDIQKTEKELEKELSVSTKHQVDEYHKIVTLYENTKSIILGEKNLVKGLEGAIAVETKELTREIAIYFGFGLFINIFTNELQSRLITLIIFLAIIGKKYLDFLLSSTRFKKLNVENNIRILENEMAKHGISNMSHHINLHQDFIGYDESLRNKGLSNIEVNKDNSLEEKFRKLELSNLKNLTDILKNVKNNKRRYYVKAQDL